MAGSSYSFRKHRRLPGQSDLDDEDKTAVRHLDDSEIWMEMAERERDLRRKGVNLAENFRFLRLSLDLTQTDMAQRLGISLRSLQMYERGERHLPSDVLVDLYVLYNIDFNQLFTSTPREPTSHWKSEFCDLALQVANDVALSFPKLTTEERQALTREYMKLATPGQPIDGGDLLMCHSALFKPENEPEE